MKNIIAIVIITSSIIVYFNKQFQLYTSWKKVPAEIISIKKILNKKNINEIRYKYKVNKIEYEGTFREINNKTIPKKLLVYYHWLNPELSIRHIPINLENILLLLISIIGGLYLYFLSCESCEIPKINNSILVQSE